LSEDESSGFLSVVVGLGASSGFLALVSVLTGSAGFGSVATAGVVVCGFVVAAGCLLEVEVEELVLVLVEVLDDVEESSAGCFFYQ